MFLKHLESDKFFKTLFSETPDLREFQIHHVAVDFQRNTLKLTLHTPLLPSGKKDGDQSAIEISYFFIKDLKLEVEGPKPMLLTLSHENKTIRGTHNGKVVLTFSYEAAKLEKWNLYYLES